MFVRACKTHVLSAGLFASRIKLVNATLSRSVHYEIRTATTDLDRFGGYLHVKHSLTDVVHYLQNPSAYRKVGIHPPKGVLLSGPPGVGKTMLAEAVAGHSGVPIIITSASDILDKWVGGAEEKLRHLFDIAKQNAPCVLLIDEFDSIAGQRFARPSTVNERHDNAIVNELLSLLSKDIPGVVVMATTNHANALDAAVTRAGRFDRHIVIPMPNYLDRLAILTGCFQHLTLANTIKIGDLAAISSNFSGATLVRWVNEAALFAVRENSMAIELSHLDKARSIIQRGSLGTLLPDERKTSVALHETGHALVGYLLGSRLYKLSILQTDESLGFAEFIPTENDVLTIQSVLNCICISLAGRAAERLFCGSEIGSSDDLRHARKWAKYLVCNEGLGRTLSGLHADADIESLLKKEMARAEQLLRENELVFHQVVAALKHENELNESDFLSVLDGTYVRSDSVKFNDKPSYPPKKKPTSVVVKAGLFNDKRVRTPVRFSNMPLFTIDEIAKAIGAESRAIHLVELGQCPGGYVVKFKPNFIKQDVFCDQLTAHDIKHEYDPERLELHIKPTNIDDFIRIIQAGSKPGGSFTGV